jgi:ISXO2-like transposase domain
MCYGGLTAIEIATVEGFLAILRRGMKGTYQHFGSQRLHRYLAEFDFRYTNRIAQGLDETMRSEELLSGIGGVRASVS